MDRQNCGMDNQKHGIDCYDCGMDRQNWNGSSNCGMKLRIIKISRSISRDIPLFGLRTSTEAIVVAILDFTTRETSK